MDEPIKLAWLYPSTLYLHGDRGNILALERIAGLMGLDLEANKIELGDAFEPDQFDIIYIPAGEFVHFPSILEELRPKKEKLETFIQEGKPLIVTGNSLNLFGKTIKRTSGEIIEGLALVDTETDENAQIYGDDILGRATYNNKKMPVIGNQIVMADIESNEQPFLELLYGYGDNKKTRSEGVKKENSIFTSVLGPLLVTNPWLTREILEVVKANKGITKKTESLDFDLEKQSLLAKENYIKNKKTHLKNCKRL